MDYWKCLTTLGYQGFLQRFKFGNIPIMHTTIRQNFVKNKRRFFYLVRFDQINMEILDNDCSFDMMKTACKDVSTIVGFYICGDYRLSRINFFN